MFGNDLCSAVVQGMQVVQLPFILQFDEDNLLPGILDFKIDPIEFVALRFLTILTFQYLHDEHFILEKLDQKAFQNFKIGLAAQQPFPGPVEADKLA